MRSICMFLISGSSFFVIWSSGESYCCSFSGLSLFAARCSLVKPIPVSPSRQSSQKYVPTYCSISILVMFFRSSVHSGCNQPPFGHLSSSFSHPTMKSDWNCPLHLQYRSVLSIPPLFNWIMPASLACWCPPPGPMFSIPKRAPGISGFCGKAPSTWEFEANFDKPSP